MADEQPRARELAFYFSLAQVGLEMVVPIGIGVALDSYLNWAPWAVVTGAVLGLLVGLTHLVALVNQQNRSGPSNGDGGVS